MLTLLEVMVKVKHTTFLVFGTSFLGISEDSLLLLIPLLHLVSFSQVEAN